MNIKQWLCFHDWYVFEAMSSYLVRTKIGLMDSEPWSGAVGWLERKACLKCKKKVDTITSYTEKYKAAYNNWRKEELYRKSKGEQLRRELGI